jgi:hypothetical protein
LYAGAVLGDQFFDETTAKLNAESYSATGLWILPSFMNHACAGCILILWLLNITKYIHFSKHLP